MAQLKQVVTVTNGSQVVTVVGFNVTDQVKSQFTFMIEVDLVPYTVASASWDGANTNIILTGQYQGVSSSLALGVFVIDFTYPHLIPLIRKGDVGTASIFSDAMWKIQAMLIGAAPDNLDEYIAARDAAIAAAAANSANNEASSAIVTEAAANALAAIAVQVQLAIDNAIASASDLTETEADSVQTAADSVQTAADRVQTAADRLQTAADLAQIQQELANGGGGGGGGDANLSDIQAGVDKAEEWAEQLKHVEVEPGKYSGLHHSAKAKDSADEAAADAVIATDAATETQSNLAASQTALAACITARDEATAVLHLINKHIYFAGLWNASSNFIPPTPSAGTPFYVIEGSGTIAGESYSANDEICWDHTGNTWFKITGT